MTLGIGRVFAAHGPLLSSDRSPYLNQDVRNLVVAGLIQTQEIGHQPISAQSNLQIAQLTAVAAQQFLNEPPPLEEALPQTANVSLQQLLKEFRSEISLMQINVVKVQKLLQQQKKGLQAIERTQNSIKDNTGTNISGDIRSYYNMFRGFGANAPIGAMSRNAKVYTDLDLSSIPIPDILFQTDIRLWETYGYYYADPLFPYVYVRWMSLSGDSSYGNLQLGDFKISYTPLTLWNYNDVYTLLEPTPFKERREDLEGLADINGGPGWILQGGEIFKKFKISKNALLSDIRYQAMFGQINPIGTYQYGQYFSGGQLSLGFFQNDLKLLETGLMLWDDPGTAQVPYISNYSATFAQRYQLGSFWPKLHVALTPNILLSMNDEMAFSDFNNDINNPGRTYQDWSSIFRAKLNISTIQLKVKYLNVGPNFYSPGSQTLRYTPEPGVGYFTTSNNEDNGLIGYRNEWVFQSISSPQFAVYDRVAENIFPYGDATPNRQGIVGGILAALGNQGWIKPEFFYTSAHEIQPNWVLNATATGLVAADSGLATAGIRTFSSSDGALRLNLGNALQLSNRLTVGGEFKEENTTGNGTSLTVKTIIGELDFVPPGSYFSPWVISLGYESARAQGWEYVLTGTTYAAYEFYTDAAAVGTYTLTDLNLSETTVAVGLKYKINSQMDLRGEWFDEQTQQYNMANYASRVQEWSINCESTF
jgi:hypothetical protein